MMVYKYRLHDPDSGKVLYEGTAADLAAQGVVRGGEGPADAVAGPAAPAQAPRQAPVGHHPGKGRSGLQPESLQGAAAAEKDGERPGKAAEATGKAEN